MRIALGRYLCWTLAAMAMSVAAPAAQAALAVTEPALVGAISSSTALAGATSVAVSGRYAYSTAYYAGGLTVIDISNPVAPTVVGFTGSIPELENAATVNIAGTYAFVVSKNRNASTSSNDDGTTGNSLTVVDIANPLSPWVVGSVRDPSRLFGAYGIAVSGRYAFIASQGLLFGQPTGPDTSTGSFSVIDLSDLSAGVVANIDNSSLRGRWAAGLDHATSVAIAGTYAYVTAFYSGHLTVINISNPRAPKVVASLDNWNHLAYSADVAVQGNYAYVADQTSGSSDQFAIVNVANPTRPSVVSWLSSGLLAGAYRIRVRGDFAYLAASVASTVVALDISNPTAPRIAAAVTDPAHLNATTGLDLGATGGLVVAASPRLATQHQPIYPPYPLKTGGAAATGTISVIDLDPAPIAIAIDAASKPPSPTQQSSAGFTFSASDAVSTVRCRLDGGLLGLCTSPTSQRYTQLVPGIHTFILRAYDAAGNTSTRRYRWMQYGAPRNTKRPKISGAASWGTRASALKASVGSWSGYPAPAFTYRWLRCDRRAAHCRVIRGQTKVKHTITASDLGARLEFVAFANNLLGSSVAASARTAVVSGTPTIRNAALTSLSTQSPRLTLSVRATPRAPPLTKLVLALPGGLSFTSSSARLSAGVVIVDSHGNGLPFSVARVRGSLVIRLPKPSTNADVVVVSPAMSVTPKIAARVREKHRKALALLLWLAVTDARNATTRSLVRLQAT